MKNNKHGILALAADSTHYYLERIHALHQQKYGKGACPSFTTIETNFPIINQFLPDQFEKLVPIMKSYLAQASLAGIRKLLLPNITLHETIDKINHGLEIAHPITACLKVLKSRSINEVIIFGSLYTMTSPYFSQALEHQNIHVIKLPSLDANRVDSFRKLVYAHQATDQDIRYFQQLLHMYSHQTSVLIACSELSQYASANSVNIIDLADLQILSMF